MLLQAIPEDRDGRWQLAIEFAEHWIRPLGEADRCASARLDAAEARLGLRLPATLRSWYETLGCSRDIWSAQDTLLAPEKLGMAGDLLVFYSENQGVWSIGYRSSYLGNDDPPVAIDEEGLGEKIRTLCPSASLLALQMLAYAVKFARPVEEHLVGYWTEATLKAIERSYARTALPPLNLFRQETIHYEGPDALIEVSGGDGYLYPSFRSNEAHLAFERAMANTGFAWQM